MLLVEDESIQPPYKHNLLNPLFLSVDHFLINHSQHVLSHKEGRKQIPREREEPDQPQPSCCLKSNSNANQMLMAFLF
jgi:hypothetical protein